MGDDLPGEPSEGPGEGESGDRRGRGRWTHGARRRSSGPPVPQLRHKRDAPAATSGAAARAARGFRRLHGRRVRRPPGHHAAGERAGNLEGSEAVGQAGGVLAGEVSVSRRKTAGW